MAQLVRARDCQSLGRRFDSVKKPDNSKSHEFELHRPSNKGTKLLLKVIKAIIIIIHTRCLFIHTCIVVHTYTHTYKPRYVYIYLYAYFSLSFYIYMYIYDYIYTYMCIYIYVHTYIYIYVYLLAGVCVLLKGLVGTLCMMSR